MELLERELQLDALRAALDEVRTGNGRVILVSGEAGIGKTSLVEQFMAEYRATRPVLWGTCDAQFTPRPLAAVYDIAQQTQLELLPLLNKGADWLIIARTLLTWLAQSDSPTIVVFEDVHWADEATLDLLKFLGRRIWQTTSLLILTYRDDEVSPRHPLQIILGDLATTNAVRRIPVPALSENAVRQMATGQEVNPVALHRQTNGNPFFITEVLASKTAGIPVTVLDAVLARVARLSLSGRALLEAAAVIGVRVEPWLLLEITGAESAATEECLAVGMLQTQADGLAFRHELARQTILDTLSPPRKLVLHRLVLAALRASSAEPHDWARLAFHAEAAGDREAVLEYAPLAARQASAVNAHREAAAQYARALRFADNLPPAEHALLLEAYATECNIVELRPDGISARRQAVELWRTLGNALKEGENLVLLIIMYFGVGQTAAAEQVSRAAIELLESLPPSRQLAKAYRMQAALHMLHRNQAEAITWGEKAITLAKRFDDVETIANAYNTIGSAWIVTDFQRGCDYLEHSLSIARDNDLPMQIANAFTNLGSGSGEVYHYHEADRYLAEGVAYTVEYDLDVSRLYMLAWQALAHLHLGRWHEAADMAATVLQYPGVSAISQIMALLALGRLRARRGDPGVWSALDDALSLAEQTQTLQRIAPVRAARAEAAWLLGDQGRTLTEARAAYDLAVNKRHPWFTGELAFWRWRAGEWLPLPPWTAVPFARHIEGSWQMAAAEWERLGCVYEQACALADGDTAAQLAALVLLEQLEAAPAANALRQKLHTEGVRGIRRGPRPATREHPYSLTTRQMDVLALLVDGLSNAYIAARLSISPRTAEHHVTAVLAKLGVHSRSEAVALALQLNLLGAEQAPEYFPPPHFQPK
ncbi:MAG: AAA family ATPase [Anaerolineae bacterium]|nr:AAA family ATPase [Anaerolineae bacterium]